MAFCKFSPNYGNENKILVDSAFINEFLPTSPDLCVKVYLMGLNKCNNADDSENVISYFSEKLKVCEDDIISIFKYWEERGIVQVLSTNPVEVRFLPINVSNGHVKKYEVDKYTDFNIQVQEIFEKRMVMPNEYVEMYNLMESKHIEQSALIAIFKYCVEIKGFNISPNYCLTVARDWERDNIRTEEQVRERITELGVIDDKVSLVLSAIGTRRRPQIEDKDLLNKWVTALGFEMNVILFVVKLLKNKKRHLDINVLDEALTKYYEMKLMSCGEIENYENQKESMYLVAIAINKELGIFYDDLTKEIDTYIVPWMNMGFDLETLKLVADNCFKSSIKTLEGLNSIINKLFKLGIVSMQAYLQYINENLALDGKIKQVLTSLNLTRNVNNMDRSFYSVWINDWGFNDEVVLYACSLCVNKINPLQYLNKILSNWNNNGIKTIDKAKQTKVEEEKPVEFIHNSYTKEQISSLISNLDEVEV